MDIPDIKGKRILVTTPLGAYAGGVSSVTEAGGIFPHHELYIEFSGLEEFGEKGRRPIEGNFGVKEFYVGRKWHKVYLLDGEMEGVLKRIEDDGRVSQEIENGLTRVYPVEAVEDRG